MGFAFDWMFTLFPIIFLVMFGLFVAMFISAIARDAKRRRKDDNSPRLVVDARVVSKRMQVGSTRHVNHHNHGSHMDTDYSYSHSTTYFVTFEVESGDRMELSVNGSDYGLMVEGDCGKLSFQGSRFLGFARS